MTDVLNLPIATAAIVVLHENGKILANTRRNSLMDWGIIGGKIEPGESSVSAAMREFQEEVGIALTTDPTYFGSQLDASGTLVDIYVVTEPYDRLSVLLHIGTDTHTIEPGILLSFVDYDVILQGSFGPFNAVLLTKLLQHITYLHMKADACFYGY